MNICPINLFAGVREKISVGGMIQQRGPLPILRMFWENAVCGGALPPAERKDERNESTFI